MTGDSTTSVWFSDVSETQLHIQLVVLMQMQVIQMTVMQMDIYIRGTLMSLKSTQQH